MALASGSAGATFVLSAQLAGADSNEPIDFEWQVVTGSSGTLDPGATPAEVQFACVTLGAQEVELRVVSDDEDAECDASATAVVECSTLCGNGLLDPGERCDPPDGVSCDASCQVTNHCPVVTSFSAASSSVYDFSSTAVNAFASDQDVGDSLTYTFSANGGHLSPFSSQSASFSCNSVGVYTVSVQVSDGKCSTDASLEITCLAGCGNGTLEPGEECDPPHTGPDGLQCGADCKLLTCGNGVVDPGEDCDPPASGRCSMSCRAMFCGNYVVDPGEQCDPPNEVDCSGTCQTIPPPPPPICAGPSAFGYWKIETELPTTVTGLWATSSNDAWLTTAARPPRYYNDVDVPSQVYRWNGSAWLPVLAGTDISIIYDQVWASGPNDAWVTGTRLRHWDGVAWADVVLPIGDVRVTTFIGGRGPDDVWVGVVSASAGGTLLFHWNGASWTDMTPPPRPDVAASGPRFVWPAASEDVWVIRGLMQPGPYGGFVVVGSDVTRWDGSAWTTATIPVEANLMSIWGSAPDDVWAAGVGMFHFDGHDWTQAVLPRAGSFWRIWGSCATDVWVTGTVPMHFNGGSWSEDLDRPAGLLPISGTSPDDLWIGGAVQTTYGGGAVSHRLLGPIRKCPSPSGIVDLGTLGGTFSQAVDINDAGQVIGATTDVPQNTVPFVWQAGRTYALTASDGAFGARAIAISNTGKIVGQTVANHVNLWEPAGSSWSVGRDIGGLGSATGYRYAYAVNDLGQIVGISATACSSGSCSNHAFFWDPSTGMADLGTLGGPSSGAIDLNNQSQVIGVSATAAGESRGFIWDPAAGLRDLGIDAFVEVRAINAVGQVIGIREVGGVRTGYVWQDGLLRDLDTHGRNVGDLRAINSVGQVVGATSDGVFLWDAVGGTHDLGPGIPLASGKRAMNDLGQLAGGVLNGTGHAAIWTPSIGTCDIGTLGGATSLAVAINAHSQVVGYSGTRTGETHAFLFQLGP